MQLQSFARILVRGIRSLALLWKWKCSFINVIKKIKGKRLILLYHILKLKNRLITILFWSLFVFFFIIISNSNKNLFKNLNSLKLC